MKNCPKCGKSYADDSLNFCLDDGEWLVGPTEGESATAILHDTASSGEAPTRQQIHTTEQTAVLRGPSVKRRSSLMVLIGAAAVMLAFVGFFAYNYFKPSSSDKIDSIGVLPFENISGNAEADYLSDGLTDSLIFRFSQLPNLKVSPTSSVMRYKGATKDVGEIAKELNVDAVLSGRLMQVGEDLSISVQLIDSRTNKLVWAEKYDRKMADLLATQREIATTLTQKMQLSLAADERGITKKYTSSSEAYQLYMKGRYHWSRRGKDDLLKAVESYKQAITLDSNFALAYAGIAEAYNSLGKNPHLSPKESVPLAKAAATRALEIDPELQQAHSALADSLAIYDWDWAASERHFKKAIELDPNVSYTHLVYGASFLSPLNNTDEALREEQKAVELEPLSLINNAVLVSGYLNARQYEKALAQARASHELDPTFPFNRHWLGFALVANGLNDEAIAICSQPLTDRSVAWLSTVVLAHAYAKSRKRVETEREIEKLREYSKTAYVRTYYLATAYSLLGDKDKAFAELERSFEDRDTYLSRARVDPFLDPLRDDPRFKDLMKRMGLPE